MRLVIRPNLEKYMITSLKDWEATSDQVDKRSRNIRLRLSTYPSLQHASGFNLINQIT